MIFVLGGLAGFTGAKATLKVPPPEVIKEEVINEKIVYRNKSECQQIGAATPSSTAAADVTSSAVPPSMVEAEPNFRKELDTLDMSEYQVSSLESSLSTLRSEVAVSRENAGWRVHFLMPDNLLAQVGVRDNDLIRFENIDEAKRSPDDFALADRIEKVLIALEGR